MTDRLFAALEAVKRPILRAHAWISVRWARVARVAQNGRER
jgi:hypothetical protein